MTSHMVCDYRGFFYIGNKVTRDLGRKVELIPLRILSDPESNVKMLKC